MSGHAETHISVNVEIGEYTITVNSSDDSWWIENSLGEGMEIGAKEIEIMFDEYFTDNF